MAAAWRSYRAGQLYRAKTFCHAILKYQPEHIDALNLLSCITCELGEFDYARALTERTVRLEPQRAEHYNNLGYILNESRLPEAAFRELQQAITLDSGYADAWLNRAISHNSMGMTDQAIADCRRSLALCPSNIRAQVNLLSFLNYSDHHSELEIFRQHVALGRSFRLSSTQLSGSTRQSQQRHGRIRIGYASPDFRTHSVAGFIAPVFEHHDCSAFELFAYYNGTRHDATSEQLRKHAEHWTVTTRLSDSALRRKIVADGIDILVDLAGHTANSRVMAFAPKAAPIQLSWIGYPNTSGLPTIDYRLCDTVTDPSGTADHLHTEILRRLPGCFLCYKPPERSPAVAPPPFRSRGYITFGSFNHRGKMTITVIDTWAKILKAVPDARLLLKNAALSGSAARKATQQLFETAGVSTTRLTLLGHDMSREQHLQRYGDIDIALDTFPYNGTTTTCEALWMGVPVITFTGNSHRSRVGSSLLQAAGLGRFVGDNVQGYVNLAIALSASRLQLVELRNQMRGIVASSRLTDAARFTTDLETLYRELLAVEASVHHSNRATSNPPG